jgi:hypothetical protein
MLFLKNCDCFPMTSKSGCQFIRAFIGHHSILCILKFFVEIILTLKYGTGSIKQRMTTTHLNLM